jgi:outer membrane protein
MKDSFMARAVALVLCCIFPVEAQSDRTPAVTYHSGIAGRYQRSVVSSFDFHDSPRIHELIRGGQLYLSLQDAIALTLENNLDIELERYGIPIAGTDTLRAKSGGTLRGVPYFVNDAPPGVGGPGAPLLNAAPSGAAPQSNITTNVSDGQFLAQSQIDTSLNPFFPFSNGPAIPQFDPALTAQVLAEHASTPETSTLITGTPALISNTVSGNAGYTQGFSPGTQVTAGFQNLRTSSNSTRNLIDPYYNSSLGVTITQPLLQGFGVNLNRRFIRIAQASQKVSDNVFRFQASLTVGGVVRLYIDLVSLNEDLRVKRQTLATAQRLAEDNRNKVEQGTLAPVEVTRAVAQVAAAQQDAINAEGLARQQELILKSVISRDFSADPVLHAAHIIPTDSLQVEPDPAQTPAELVQTALLSRPDYLAAQGQLAVSEIALKGSRNALLPQLDLVANASNSGLAGGVNPAYASSGLTGGGPGSLLGYNQGLGSALEQLLRRDYPTYSIGLNLNLPLRNRAAQADEARDELQFRQVEVRRKQLENTIRVQVEDAVIALERTRAAYGAATEARKLQEQSLEIEHARFDAGLSTTFLVIQYESTVAQARSTEVAALGAYAKARSQLDAVMGIILRAHRISLEQAYKGRP